MMEDMQQVVDWTDPARQRQLRRGHLIWLLRRSGVSLVAVLLVFGVGLWWLVEVGTVWFLLGALLCAGLIAWRFRTYLSGLDRAMRAARTTTYQLQEGDLHVQNALGTWTIPWDQIERVELSGGVVLVTYAGRSLLSLPDGPLARAVQSRWAARRGPA